MRILLTSFALPGHFLPLVGLAWGFRAAGHEVRIAVADRFAAVALRSGLPVVASGPTADFVDLCADAADGAGEGARVRGRAFGTIAAQTVPGVEQIVHRWRPDLVVSERAEFAGPVVAARCGIPHVQLHWGVAPLDVYRDAGAEAMGCRIPVPDAVVDPWPPSLRLPHARGHLAVRHVPSNGDAEVPPWVHDGHRPVRVALTLGTLLPRLDPDAWSAAASALAHVLPDGVEVVVATDGPHTAGVLPARVRHTGRLPLAEVLTACDVLVHHGGQGTTLTALAAGCPQVVRPRIDDQLDNADAVVRSGAGLRSDPADADPSALGDAVARLVDDGRFRAAARDAAAEIARQPSAAEVAATLGDLAGRRARVA